MPEVYMLSVWEAALGLSSCMQPRRALAKYVKTFFFVYVKFVPRVGGSFVDTQAACSCAWQLLLHVWEILCRFECEVYIGPACG